MSKLIETLQNKPLQTRIKIFWVSVVIAGVVLAGLWGTLAVANKSQSQKQGSQDSLLEKFKALFAESRDTVGLGAAVLDKEPVTILQVAEVEGGRVIILFNVTNDSDYILTLLNPEENTTPKIAAEDGNTDPISVATADGLPFPGKILSKTSLAGSMLVEKPASGTFTLQFTNIYYDTGDAEKFNQDILTEIGYTVQTNNPDELLPRQ